MVTPAGRGRGISVPGGRGGGGTSGIPRRGTAPPGGIRAPMGQDSRQVTGSAMETQVPPVTTSTGPEEIRTTLETFRDEILATVSQALSQGPAGQDGSRDPRRSTRSSSRRRRSRRHRSHGSSTSSISSGTTLSSAFDEDDLTTFGDTTRGPDVISCSDDRFSLVLDYRTYRLRNKKATYGIREARKMGRVTRNMKHSFAGYPHFSGKEGLKVFTWLRKLVMACNDNGVLEGMALYAIPHFLSGDAELRYTRALPDSTSASGGASITSYPEAINWFLETYAEPHALALAQDKFGRATKGPDETIEAFALRLRGLTEMCGNIHTEGTMKQQLIQGLPEYLRTDAFVYNGPKRTYQQLVTFTAGKYKAARDVITMAQSAGSSNKAPVTGPVRRPTDLNPKKVLDPPALLTANPMAPPTILKGPLDKEIEKTKAGQTQGFHSETPRLVGIRTMDSRRPYRCYLCWESGHMAHQCKTLSEAQRQAVTQARDMFLSATRGRSQTTETDANADRRFHRQVRVAMVQALCEGINKSDDEPDQSYHDTTRPGSSGPSGKE